MLFNSLAFAIFFAIIYVIYRGMGRSYRWQNLMLLVASYIFYGWWDVRFLFLILFSTTLDFCTSLLIDRGRLSRLQRFEASGTILAAAVGFLGVRWDAVSLSLSPPGLAVDWANLWAESSAVRWGILATVAAVCVANAAYPWIARLPERTRSRLALAASIVVNLGILGFFKYFNFFADSFSSLWQGVFGVAPDRLTLDIILPVGISFYTFQSMSYTIDVYRKELKASERLAEYAVFVSFFPQLVAGPIERASHLLPQFRGPRSLPDGQGVRDAVWLIAWGLYKKVVVADNMALLVNGIFGPYDELGPDSVAAAIPHDGLRLLIGVYAFAFQIYGDFSGYTDMARGVARLLGFDIMLNFNLPYFATSPSDFWRRWHISLSTWLRDYLYIGLGGNRGTALATYRNLFLTMLLGGLWHGASWTFVIWGAYHGLLLIAFRLFGLRTEQKGTPLAARVPMGILMFHLTCVGWLLFRAQNVETLKVFLKSILLSPHGSAATLAVFSDLAYYGWFLVVYQVLQAVSGTLNPLPKLPWLLRLTVWVFVVMSILRLAPKTAQEFIYFAF